MTVEGLPDIVARRLGRGAFSSALSVQDFASCELMGLEPVDLVEGCCVMTKPTRIYSGYLANGYSPTLRRSTVGGRYMGPEKGYTKRFRCPHGLVAWSGHETYGANFEQRLMSTAWHRGYDLAYSRMMDQAAVAGAHGVIGIVDDPKGFGDLPATEFRVVGTAVRVVGAPSSTTKPWTTYLAGRRLAKVVEMGFMPVSVVVQRTWIRVAPYCMTKYLTEGANIQRGGITGEVLEADQLSDARMAAIQVATNRLKAQIGSDVLFGVAVETSEEELPEAGRLFGAFLSGTRLRKYRSATSRSAPTPTVRLR